MVKIVRNAALFVAFCVGLTAAAHLAVNWLAGAPVEHAPMEQTLQPRK